MKPPFTLAVLTVFLAAFSTFAQPGPRGGMGGPGGLDAGLQKLFGVHKAWTASVETTVNAPQLGGPMTMPSTMFVLDGNTRTEMDMSKMKSAAMPPGAAEQMKAMGLAEMVSIVRMDKQKLFIVYPGMQSYLEQALPPASSKGEDKFKVELTGAGKETVGGHPCVKSSFTIIDDAGQQQKGTIWKATDLKDFPLRLQLTQQGTEVTMEFSNVKLEKPASAQFDPPPAYKRFESQQAMMQEIMAKRFGAGGGFPVPPTPKK